MRTSLTTRGCRGSTLLLFPAALLVIVALAAVTVDLARVHLAQRELDDLAAGAANDLVTVALDEEALRSTGEYQLRSEGLAELTADVVRRSGSRLLARAMVVSSEIDGHSVTIRLLAPVDLPFSQALPGGLAGVTVRAEATATAHLR